MSSQPTSDALDLDRDLPTTAEDLRVLRRLRRVRATWLESDRLPLDPQQVLAALRRRPTARAEWAPFELPSL